mgnify:CR=1 FL=1
MTQTCLGFGGSMTDAKELCEKRLAGGGYALVLACMADACALQSEEEALAGANVMSAGANAAADAYATEPFVCEFEPSFACGGGPGFNARHPDDAFSRCYYDPQCGCWDKDGLDPVEAARNADRCGTDECAAAWDTVDGRSRVTAFRARPTRIDPIRRSCVVCGAGRPRSPRGV